MPFSLKERERHAFITNSPDHALFVELCENSITSEILDAIESREQSLRDLRTHAVCQENITVVKTDTADDNEAHWC